MDAKRLALAALLCLGAARLHADLGDFQQNVEAAERDRREKEAREDPAPKPSTGAESTRDGSTLDGSIIGSIFGAILKGIGLMWSVNNTTTTFGDYPYDPDGYICWAKPREGPNGSIFDQTTTGKRSQRFTLSTEGAYLPGIGFGAGASFRGYLWRFFGPDCEDIYFAEGSSGLNICRLGLDLSLLHSEYLSLNLYGQWVSWSGVFARDGGAFGLAVESYPLNPLTIRMRIGGQFFPAYTVGEFDAQVGFAVRGVGLYVGYRHWWLSGDPALRTWFYDGVSFGVNLFF